MEDYLQWETTSNGRRPQNIEKKEYLSIHWSHLPQILNLSSENKPKSKMFEMQTTSNGRLPQMEDVLKLLKVEYFSNR
jgi:hypothetical protein